ncbi:MAG: AarF/ABC1/UbiB kinase family protein [Deltaproteobacteria bacterium]|nr:AarF/ABC1/UbiB kinase family protein [Deltaproteobacteria bacterium]
MTFLRIHLAYKNLQRLRQIITILIKHGFYPIIERIHLTKLISLHQRIAGKKATAAQDALSLAVRTRLAFEELGPTFIKFGQILSTRPDLLSEEFIREFLKLQDEVPPFPFQDIIKVIEQEFKRPAKELFKEIEEKPIAAASIAQVHKAVTMDGKDVVIKVQRPDIEATIDNDISILQYLAKLIVKYIPESRSYDPVGMVEEFALTIKKEMDFTLEASYTERFKKNHSDDPRVFIPGIYWELTGKRALTMERIDGIKIDNIEKLKATGIDTEKISHIVAEVLFRQVFEFGVFHGDLHSGNIFVAGPEQIVFVDFGIVGRIDKEMQENLADIFVGLVSEDYELLTRVYLRMGILPEDIDEVSFKREYQDMLFSYFGKPFKRTSVGELFMDYLRLARRHKIKMPRELLLLDKCILELEGLGRLLHPDVNVLVESQQFARKLIAKRFGPGAVAKGAIDTVREYQTFIHSFPHQMSQILKKMMSDKFTIDFVHKGLEDLMGEMDRSSNRLTFGVIIAALIIGSSLVLAFGSGPKLFGFPFLGILGFAVAGILGLWLAFLILRSGKF